MYSYLCGLDLGQANDFSVLSVLEVQFWRPDTGKWISPADIDPRRLPDIAYSQGQLRQPNPLHVRNLERYPLGTSYAAIVRDVSNRLHSGAMHGKGVALIIDRTGVGRAVFDQFVAAGIRPVGVSIHGGDQVLRENDGSGYRVPKRDLIGSLQVALQNRTLVISKQLDHAATLREEALNMRVSISASGHDSYAADWRAGTHDDIVLSVALPVWFYDYRIDRMRRVAAAQAA